MTDNADCSHVTLYAYPRIGSYVCAKCALDFEALPVPPAPEVGPRGCTCGHWKVCPAPGVLCMYSLHAADCPAAKP